MHRGRIRGGSPLGSLPLWRGLTLTTTTEDFLNNSYIEDNFFYRADFSHLIRCRGALFWDGSGYATVIDANLYALTKKTVKKKV